MPDKAKMRYLVPCDFASLDSNNKLNALGIFNNVKIHEGGTGLIFSLVGELLLGRGFEGKSLEVKLLSPNQKEFFKIEGELSSEGEVKPSSYKINFRLTLNFVDTGFYSVVVKVGDDVVHEDDKFIEGVEV